MIDEQSDQTLWKAIYIMTRSVRDANSKVEVSEAQTQVKKVRCYLIHLVLFNILHRPLTFLASHVNNIKFRHGYSIVNVGQQTSSWHSKVRHVPI